MKIVITGHTSGVGKALYEYYTHENNFHHTIGLSRSSGYDLDTDLDKFVVDDFSVYFNNAYSGFQQTNLLYKLFEANKHRRCNIINIGSVSSDGNKDYPNEYAVHKASLEKACKQLQLVDSDCMVHLLKPGRLNTPMTDHKSDYPRLNPQALIAPIEMMIKAYPAYIKEMTVDILHSRRINKS